MFLDIFMRTSYTFECLRIHVLLGFDNRYRILHWCVISFFDNFNIAQFCQHYYINSCFPGLELGIGLCVDYAAHVAHAFINAASVSGNEDRTKRAHIAVRYIGAAVAYGAGSTLLALSMMVFSDSYVFHAFLKIFVLVILFGLWHGLFLLPVILSTIGPGSLRSHKEPESPEKVEDTGDTVTSPLNKETES